MDTKLGHLEIFVRDPLKSKDFYTDVLGFELVEVQDERFIWLKMGDSVLLLRPGAPKLESERYQNANMAMVIYSSDTEGTLNRYKSRGLIVKGEDTGCPTFTDLDGNWFQLVNPEEHSK